MPASLRFNTLFVSTLRLTLLITCWLAGMHVHAQDLLIKNVRIISGHNPVASAPQHIHIANGVVHSIMDEHALKAQPPSFANTQVVDAHGQFAIPGLIDSHVHLHGIPGVKDTSQLAAATRQGALAQIPRSYLYYGFTTLLDLSNDAATINQWNERPIAPKAYFCSPLVLPKSYPAPWLDGQALLDSPYGANVLFAEQYAALYPTTINRAVHSPAAQIQRAKQEGASCIKLFYEPGFGPFKNLPLPPAPLFKEVTRLAKAQGLPVFLHANGLTGYQFGLEVGVDVLAHGLWHNRQPNLAGDQETQAFTELAKAFAKNAIAVHPTQQVVFGEVDMLDKTFFGQESTRHSIPAALLAWYQSDEGQWMSQQLSAGFTATKEQDIHTQMKNRYASILKRTQTVTGLLHQHNAPLLFGTDTPSGPIYTQFPGLNGHKEIQHWYNAGVSLTAIFKALTVDNARAMNLSDVGEIRVGKRADILLLREDPLQSITAYDSIEQVILGGQMIERKSLSAN